MNIENLDLSLLSKISSRLELWQYITNTFNKPYFLEIGVWKGDYSEHILANCNNIERYYMIDPWENMDDWNKPYNFDQRNFDAIYAEAMIKTDFCSSKRTVLRGRTIDVIDKIPDNNLDIIYIDGDHTLRGITIDLIKALPKLKIGGIIGGDDFKDISIRRNIKYEPNFVFPFSIYFAEAMSLPVAALPFNQFILQKTENAKFQFLNLTSHYHDLSVLSRLEK